MSGSGVRFFVNVCEGGGRGKAESEYFVGDMLAMKFALDKDILDFNCCMRHA